MNTTFINCLMFQRTGTSLSSWWLHLRSGSMKWLRMISSFFIIVWNYSKCWSKRECSMTDSRTDHALTLSSESLEIHWQHKPPSQWSYEWRVDSPLSWQQMSSNTTNLTILNSSDMVHWEQAFSRRTSWIATKASFWILNLEAHEHHRWLTKWRTLLSHTAIAQLLSEVAAFWTQDDNQSVNDLSSSTFLTGRRLFQKGMTHPTVVLSQESWDQTTDTFTPA